MPSNDMPLNKAHQHASNAEDYINQGLLVLAAEEHCKSAEAFLQCVEQASDDGTKRTLRMLHNEHSKSGKELQRKITKLKQEGKDPSLPQATQAPFPTERAYESPEHSTRSPAAPSCHSNHRSRLSDSNYTIDESYMVLGQKPDHTFNEFWKVFEGMLDNLSQPVAFATAPLARPKSSGWVNTELQTHNGAADDKPTRRDQSTSYVEMQTGVGLDPEYNGKTWGQTRPGQDFHLDVSGLPCGSQKAHYQLISKPNMQKVAGNSDPELDEVLADPDSPSGEAFFMIPSALEPATTRLQQENISLKSQIELLQQQLQAAEQRRLDQEQQVREGISQARREAQRVMNASHLSQRPIQHLVDPITLNLNIPPLPSTFHDAMGNREAQFIRRIKEMEEELQVVRQENEKQRAMIVKFRERWEKLKESAKRKRNAKASAGLRSVREERIDEEPEAEAEVEAEQVSAES